MSTNPMPGPQDYDEARKLAFERVKARRDFVAHLVTYLVVNAFLVVVWYVTNSDGYFWPIWVIAGWGVGLALNAWSVYGRRAITEEDVDREMRRGRPIG
ncbi:2TM domain-containing protein [Actinotalea sp. M2MS4P-6]|uniref:2TM domain-containing protein n=1 Tax=Actinotalea sp. M2MS4P-6 TaxID=2983762 RepID=UPI0021E3F077|nr:2TM domain-containing protein [Actinotalea sp. M2MS4P-6]MCV2393660.1 2TM domain-containing protein [Actinotalea sp. M2MS4P-6]